MTAKIMAFPSPKPRRTGLGGEEDEEIHARYLMRVKCSKINIQKPTGSKRVLFRKAVHRLKIQTLG